MELIKIVLVKEYLLSLNTVYTAVKKSGDVSLVRLEKPIEMRDVFVVEDSKRGNFIIGIRN